MNRNRAALILLAAGAALWSRPIEVTPRPPLALQHVQVGVDPNTAPWWELTALPGIGFSTAEKILAYRDARIDRRPVFQRPADLDPVPGIGTKTLARIGRHLRVSKPS